jgi:hypothetical protein
MSGAVISDSATTYTRVSKRYARKLWAKDEPLYVIPHKLRPGGSFQSGLPLDWITGESFDDKVEEFTSLNCSHETGYYPAFYVMHDRK